MIPATGVASPAQPPADISLLEFMAMGKYLWPRGHKKKWLEGDISVEATHARAQGSNLGTGVFRLCT